MNPDVLSHQSSMPEELYLFATQNPQHQSRDLLLADLVDLYVNDDARAIRCGVDLLTESLILDGSDPAFAYERASVEFRTLASQMQEYFCKNKVLVDSGGDVGSPIEYMHAVLGAQGPL